MCIRDSYRNGQHYALEQHKKLRTVYKFALKNIKNMEMSVAETWHHKVKYLKFHEGQDVYYFHKVDNIGHKKIKSPYHLAKIVKVYPADVYLIKLKSSGRQIMSSYNKLTLKPIMFKEIILQSMQGLMKEKNGYT